MSRDSEYAHVDVGHEVVKVAACIEHHVILNHHEPLSFCKVCGQVFYSGVIVSIKTRQRIGATNHGKAQI